VFERWANRSLMRAKKISTAASTEREQTRHLDELLDQALADSFPASDPVSSLATDDHLPTAQGREDSAPQPIRDAEGAR
jgi:hypothetical protein